MDIAIAILLVLIFGIALRIMFVLQDIRHAQHGHFGLLCQLRSLGEDIIVQLVKNRKGANNEKRTAD